MDVPGKDKGNRRTRRGRGVTNKEEKGVFSPVEMCSYNNILSGVKTREREKNDQGRTKAICVKIKSADNLMVHRPNIPVEAKMQGKRR